MKKLGLYIHIPFCKRKCAYCDFVSYPNMEHTFDRYVDAVICEARLFQRYLTEREVDTVFIGGGTPPLLSAEQIGRMVIGLKDSTNWNAREFSIEANPETLEEEKIAAFSKTGINRISLGLQTHEDEILQRICRRHTYKTFLDAYDTVRNHIKNINVDLIFGLPGQSIESFSETVRRLIKLKPQHISAYSLKLEEGTPLHKQFGGVSDSMDREMYHTAVRLLLDAGYVHYETSNFALNGFECAHNIKYWTGREYLGLGVAAHSYIDNGTKSRHSNTEYVEQYLKRVGVGELPIAERTLVALEEEEEEYIMLRLRLAEGIVLDDYQNRFGQRFDEVYTKEIAQAKSTGLILKDSDAIRPTLKGFDLQNTLITLFMKKL